MKIVPAILALSLASIFTNSAFAGPCLAGSLDKVVGNVTGIVGGSSLVQLADDTSVQIVSVPSGIYPNYEVTAMLSLAKPIQLGSTVRFSECQGADCKIGAVVTLAEGAMGVRGGSRLATLAKGSRVQITDIPAGMNVNYEVTEIVQSETIMLSSTIQFKNCQK